MGRVKRIRLKENLRQTNILHIDGPAGTDLRGQWNARVFRNRNPIMLELGCGKGKFSVGLAARFPERNVIGVDVKGDRLWAGAGDASRRELSNLVFVRTQVQRVAELFGRHEVDEIWLTFPDPLPKGAYARQRLTAPGFLEKYREILHPQGTVNLKTDDDGLFDFTWETVQARDDVTGLIATRDLYRSAWRELAHGITTSYEDRFLNEGKTIKFLQFRFAAVPPSV